MTGFLFIFSCPPVWLPFPMTFHWYCPFKCRPRSNACYLLWIVYQTLTKLVQDKAQQLMQIAIHDVGVLHLQANQTGMRHSSTHPLVSPNYCKILSEHDVQNDLVNSSDVGYKQDTRMYLVRRRIVHMDIQIYILKCGYVFFFLHVMHLRSTRINIYLVLRKPFCFFNESIF